MYKHFNDYKNLSDEELANASFIIEKMLQDGLTLRNNPKYRKKFLNQPPPSINPALSELRANIANEIKLRQKEKENEPKS